MILLINNIFVWYWVENINYLGNEVNDLELKEELGRAYGVEYIRKNKWEKGNKIEESCW